MTDILIALYLDEDVDILIARLIEAHGFKATTARDAGQLRRSDAEQLAYATSQSLTLVTHNRADYESLARYYFEEGLVHSGIIIANRRSPYDLADRLRLILNYLTADEMQSQVQYI